MIQKECSLSTDTTHIETHYTAAEVIFNRVNSDKENMGLMSWKNAPEGRIRKIDAIVAKNYLVEDIIFLIKMQ